MKYYDWDNKKNEKLKLERDICFEDIIVAIDDNGLLDIIQHANIKKYPNQKIFIININNYAYLIPFIENKDKIFLKTIIPSRKATKKYILNVK